MPQKRKRTPEVPLHFRDDVTGHAFFVSACPDEIRPYGDLAWYGSRREVRPSRAWPDEQEVPLYSCCDDLLIRGRCREQIEYADAVGYWQIHYTKDGKRWHHGLGEKAYGPALDDISAAHFDRAGYPEDLFSASGDWAFYMVTWIADAKSRFQSHRKHFVPSTSRRYSPNDVAFIFPRESCPEPYLWSNSLMLRQASPFWAQQLEPNSGFEESVNVLESAHRAQTELNAGLEELLAARRESTPPTRTSGRPAKTRRISKQDKSGSSRVRYVVVENAALGAYQAVFDWVSTGRIVFAEDAFAHSDGSSFPPSSRAVYALAHFLEIKPLQELAVLDFVSQLTLDKVVPELFSDHALLYPKWQSMVMQLVRENWKELKQSKHHLQITQQICKAGGDSLKLEGSTRILVELLASV